MIWGISLSNKQLRPIELDDALFEGHISLQREGGTVTPWRIPFDQYDLFPPNGLNGFAQKPAGIRLRFKSDTPTVTMIAHVEIDRPTQEVRFDCLVDGGHVESKSAVEGTNTILFEQLPSRDKLIEIYLPVTCRVAISSLHIPQDATFSFQKEPRKRWTTYGSSITQCGASDGPSQTWPALVAQKHNLNLTCLGFGGNCHLEPMVARLIRDTPADLITLCLGINVYGSFSLGPRTFKSSVIGLIQIIREKHPDVPIGVLSPIASPPRETTPNKVGLTLVTMREEIEDAVARLEAAGDRRLLYVDGLNIFNVNDAKERMPDLLHPDAEGYRMMADRIDKFIFSDPRFTV